MKTTLVSKVKLASMIVALPLSISAATAAHINGSISFAGSVSLDANIPNATEFVSFDSVRVSSGTQTGDYVGTSGTSVSFSPFSFDPFASSVDPLWWFSDDGVDYSFTMNDLMTFERSSLGSDLFRLSIAGAGLASITGFDDTWGAFSLTTTGNHISTDHGFGAFTFVARSVPDTASTATLFGFGVLLLAAASRRRRRG